jgi:hypothetical protein
MKIPRQLPALLAVLLTALLAFLFAVPACVAPNGSGSVTNGTSTSTGVAPTGHVSLSVFDSSGNLVYSDTDAATALLLTSGVTYDLQLTGTDVPAGTIFTLQATNVDAVDGATTSVVLTLGDNSYVPPTPGDFVLDLSSANTSIAPEIYQASIQCAQPTFTAASLSGAGIVVTAGSGSNLYDYSASGVVTAANGMAPYLCAWDLNGDGTQDTPFRDCGTTVSNEYVDYVGSRNVGVLVKDACNTTQSVRAAETLAYTVPAMPGNVFIFGQVSGASGTAQGDPRIDGVSYLATNSGGHNIVQPSYTSGTAGRGAFTIQAPLIYGLPSSVSFGMELDLTGFSDTLNVSAGTGTVDASAAVLSRVLYSTDEAGDQSPPRSLVGTPCTLTQPGANVVFQQGTPCSAGTTGDQNSADVEVWGDYVCVVSDGAGTATVTGSFDGISHLADSCVGGGGGGGGGINPVQL